MLFFFNHTATTEIYTLSLHDALPIFNSDTFQHIKVKKLNHLQIRISNMAHAFRYYAKNNRKEFFNDLMRSEEHTSELQSLTNLVCRLLLEKKKIKTKKDRKTQQ